MDKLIFDFKYWSEMVNDLFVELFVHEEAVMLEHVHDVIKVSLGSSGSFTFAWISRGLNIPMIPLLLEKLITISLGRTFIVIEVFPDIIMGSAFIIALTSMTTWVFDWKKLTGKY
jgi:hypothetical protein